MAALVRQLKRTSPALAYAVYLLLALTLLGIGLSIYRLAVGLGPTTNLSDYYPWGIWISVDLFLIPVAGAAFTISLISYFFGRERYHSVIRPAVLAGVIGYGVVGVLLFLDIGRWTQFYNIFNPRFINLHSFLEEISLCVTLYTGILILEILPVILERWNIQTPTRWINRGIYIIAGAGIVLSALHQSSLGSLFLIMRHKLHPLWWTPALPVLFFLQATYTGLGMTAIAVTLIWRAKGIPLDRELFRRIGQAMSLNLLLYLAIKAGDWMGAGEIPLLLQPDAYGWLAWFELVIGVFIPMAILFSKLIRHSAAPFWAGVFALIGTFINRLVVSWIGLAQPSPVAYTPHWIEIAITIGIMSGGVLLYALIAYYFRLLPERHAAAPNG